MEGKKLMFLLLLVASTTASPIPQAGDNSRASPKPEKAAPSPAIVREEAKTPEQGSAVSGIEPSTPAPDPIDETKPEEAPKSEAAIIREDATEKSPESEKEDVEREAEAESDNSSSPQGANDPENSETGQDASPTEADESEAVMETPASQGEEIEAQSSAQSSAADAEASEGETTDETPVIRDDQEAVTESAGLLDESTTDALIDDAPEEEISSHTLFRSENVIDEDDVTTIAPKAVEKSSDLETRVESAVEEEIEPTTPQPEENDEMIASASEVEEVKVSLPNDAAASGQDESKSDAIISVRNEPEESTVTERPVEDELTPDEENFKFAAPIEIVEVEDNKETDAAIALKDTAPIEIVEITESSDTLNPAENAEEAEADNTEPASNDQEEPASNDQEEPAVAEESEKPIDEVETEKEQAVAKDSTPSSDQQEEEASTDATPALESQDQEGPSNEATITSKKQSSPGGDYWISMQRDSEDNAEATTTSPEAEQNPIAIREEEAAAPQAQEEESKSGEPTEPAGEKEPEQESEAEKEAQEQKPRDSLNRPLVKESEKPKADPLQRGSQIHFQESNSLQRRLM